MLHSYHRGDNIVSSRWLCENITVAVRKHRDGSAISSRRLCGIFTKIVYLIREFETFLGVGEKSIVTLSLHAVDEIALFDEVTFGIVFLKQSIGKVVGVVAFKACAISACYYGVSLFESAFVAAFIYGPVS